MEVKIGVVYTPKELTVESEGTVDELVGRLEQALKDGDPVVWMVDSRGRRVGVPADKIAYIEIGSDEGAKRVGFGVG
ncbi:MAG: DUF3107 domain-containing protein [Acidimicrobiia bacterium]